MAIETHGGRVRSHLGEARTWIVAAAIVALAAVVVSLLWPVDDDHTGVDRGRCGNRPR
jgi:hypothetical protein